MHYVEHSYFFCDFLKFFLREKWPLFVNLYGNGNQSNPMNYGYFSWSTEQSNTTAYEVTQICSVILSI